MYGNIMWMKEQLPSVKKNTREATIDLYKVLLEWCLLRIKSCHRPKVSRCKVTDCITVRTEGSK